MRAKSRTELFELVCEAAVYGGKFTSTTIGIVRTGNDYLDIVATAGTDGCQIQDLPAIRQGRLSRGARRHGDRLSYWQALRQQRLYG